jgi:hypothetical protein
MGRAAAVAKEFKSEITFDVRGSTPDWSAFLADRAHGTDIVPTILDVCAVPFPDVYNGVAQRPLAGVSMRYSFDAADAPTQKVTQYRSMFGQRGIWHQGWKAVAEHGPMAGMSNFDGDRWQLFHTDVDRSEAHDVADEHTQKVEELKALWMEEAMANNVLPLNDMQLVGKDLETFLSMEFRVPVAPSVQYTYYPGTSAVPERSAANVHGVSYKVLADVEVTRDTEGVIFAQGWRFGSLFIKDGQLTYAYNFLGIPPEARFSAAAPTPDGTSLASSSSRNESATITSRTGRASCTSTRRSSPRPSCRPRPGTSPYVARACASATTAVTR